MRVAFQHGAVHERARVAFVGVADHVFLVGFVRRGKAPFEPRGEAAAAAAAQTGILHDLDDLFGLELGQALGKRLIAVVGDIFVDIFGIDDAAVAQRHALLLFIEVGFLEGFDLFRRAGFGLIVKQTLHDTTLEQMLFHDLGHVFHFHFAVEAAFGINHDDRTECAKTEAAGADDLDFVFQTLFLDLGFKLFDDLRGV